jgi:hypothetical protein
LNIKKDGERSDLEESITNFFSHNRPVKTTTSSSELPLLTEAVYPSHFETKRSGSCVWDPNPKLTSLKKEESQKIGLRRGKGKRSDLAKLELVFLYFKNFIT